MTIDPVVIGADAQASEAERLLKTYHVSGLPVVSGDATVGVISLTDLMVARSTGMISGNWDQVLVPAPDDHARHHRPHRHHHPSASTTKIGMSR